MDNVTSLDLAAIRQKLEAERERLLASLSPEGGVNGRSQSRNPDRGDLAEAYSSRERNLALQAIEAEQLEQIEDALERLDEGRYGQCENCGQEIPPGRLEILPHATLCVNCQSQQERMYGTV
jgi:RNA polymerase-binding protein DksA